MKKLHLAVAVLLAACGQTDPPANTQARTKSQQSNPCSYLTFEEIKAATGIAPISAASTATTMSCSWDYNGKMLGQPAKLVLVSVSVVPQRYKVPETFEKFRADFEKSFGQPWDGMTQVEGLGKYAWSDGSVLQAMSEDGTLVSLTIARDANRSLEAYRQLAAHALNRL